MKVFKRKKNEERITREQALNSIPVKSGEVFETRLDSGEVQLIYPIVLRPWMASLARHLGASDITRKRKLQLDALGTSVWSLLDGKRSVKALIRQFAESHRMPSKEAEVSVTRFLRELGRRGLIGLQ